MEVREIVLGARYLSKLSVDPPLKRSIQVILVLARELVEVQNLVCLAENALNTKNTAQNASIGITSEINIRIVHALFQNIMATSSKESLLSYPSTNYYCPHVTKQEYNQAFDKAYLWALESDEHRLTAAARIYHVKELALQESVLWSKQKV